MIRGVRKALALVPFLIAACGPAPEGGVCRVMEPSREAATYEVQLGTRSSGMFVPWGDGDQVGAVRGGQGAAMVVPRVRIPNAPADATELCMRVEVDHELDTGRTPFSMLAVDETFRVLDGGWESVSIEVPIDYGDVNMHMIDFTVNVRGDTFVAEGNMTFELIGGT